MVTIVSLMKHKRDLTVSFTFMVHGSLTMNSPAGCGSSPNCAAKWGGEDAAQYRNFPAVVCDRKHGIRKHLPPAV
ncbi:MAG: hypothetical protein LDL41_12420 [Coleofasciculus sp. S288]|nr:hypothetical protein [Coleofasciculus sp. S288]